MAEAAAASHAARLAELNVAPEVIAAALSGKGGFDLLAADVWSLGVCLYCLFNNTGLPFRAKDAKDLLRMVTSREPPPLDHLSGSGTQLLAALLAKRPADRPTASAAGGHAWCAAASPGRPRTPSAMLAAAQSADAASGAAEGMAAAATSLRSAARECVQGMRARAAQLDAEEGERMAQLLGTAVELQLQRVDENLDDSLSNVNEGLGQLQRYMRNMSSNRGLLVRVFAILLFFVVVWGTLFA